MTMGTPILDTTVQAAVMSAASNAIAQSLTAYQHKVLHTQYYIDTTVLR